MLQPIDADDQEFLDYLFSQLPVGFIAMTWQDFNITKKLKEKDKITNSDIHRLELKLKLGEYKKVL